jgi:hypothetical protein
MRTERFRWQRPTFARLLDKRISPPIYKIYVSFLDVGVAERQVSPQLIVVAGDVAETRTLDEASKVLTLKER